MCACRKEIKPLSIRQHKLILHFLFQSFTD
uniref:Uncharacterized protein n=1 Tax=Anguilla anguilla TaxID=7936 RepID=A0A0E9SPQ4_ANGAN